jgi:hypothetical protein
VKYKDNQHTLFVEVQTNKEHTSQAAQPESHFSFFAAEGNQTGDAAGWAPPSVADHWSVFVGDGANTTHRFLIFHFVVSSAFRVSLGKKI